MSLGEKRESTDEVLQEVWQIKEKLAASMNFDIDRIIDDAMRKQQASGRKLLPPPARKAAR